MRLLKSFASVLAGQLATIPTAATTTAAIATATATAAGLIATAAATTATAAIAAATTTTTAAAEAATATTTAAAKAATATAAAFSAGTSFVHSQGASVEGVAIEFFSCRFSFCVGFHRDESKTAGFTREFVLHEDGFLDLAGSGKQILQIDFGCVEGKISHKEFSTHILIFFYC